jgi:Kef-type K+ transport system membrane component KefB/nucleotide-binding universal stress UspA family protein
MTVTGFDISKIINFPVHDPVLIFAIILVIIFISPLLLRKFNVPGIIILIISGIIIGPNGLNIIENNGAIDLFSTIGILFLMFIAGLNLDQQQFRRTRYKSLLFGILTYIIPFIIGLPVCYYLLHYNFITSLMIANMFSTHTMVSYPVVSRLNITRNEAVAVATGGTVVTDTLVLLVLAAISGKVTGGAGVMLYVKLLVFFLIFLVILVYLIPPISRWVFKRLEDDNYSQFIYVALVVFVCAIVAKVAGLEPIIGAFAAGFIMSNLIPPDSMLRNRINFTGNALFIPFFLISVGMIVNLHGIFTNPQAIIVAIVLTVVALIGKYLAAGSTSWIIGFSKDQRKLLFGLTSSHAAAILAVIMVGYKLGIIDNTIINGTILLILITCIVSSFVTDSAGRKIALSTGGANVKPVREYDESIIVSLSNPNNMEKLLDLALNLKKKDHSQPLYGLCVVNDDEDAVSKLHTARTFLRSVTERAQATGRQIETLATIDINISAGIKRVAREKDATDIIIGSSGKFNFADFIFGRSIEQLLDSATQNVFVYNPVLTLNLCRKIIMFIPQNAEKEAGFNSFINRISHLSIKLGVPLTIKAKVSTCDIVVSALAKTKEDLHVLYYPFDYSAPNIEKELKFEPEDLIVFFAPRNGSISYNADYESLIKKTVKALESSNYLIFYSGLNI